MLEQNVRAGLVTLLSESVDTNQHPVKTLSHTEKQQLVSSAANCVTNSFAGPSLSMSTFERKLFFCANNVLYSVLTKRVKASRYFFSCIRNLLSRADKQQRTFRQAKWKAVKKTEESFQD